MINLQKLKQSHERFLRRHDAALTVELVHAKDEGVKVAKNRPRFTPRTGKTQAKNTGKVIRTKRGGVVTLRNTAKHAAALDRGARPHVIRARRRKFLRFRGRDGSLVFVRSVRHPGNKPYRFLSSARDVASTSFARSMASRMRELARQF